MRLYEGVAATIGETERHELNKSAIRAQPPAPTTSTLKWHPAPPDLARCVLGFVHRDDSSVGAVMRLLPEVRCSIQINLADPYWLRERRRGAPWAMLPTVALWGPRYEWAYGFANQHIKVYATALTAAGFAALTQQSAARMVNRVVSLDAFQPALAAAIQPKLNEAFDAWRRRAIALLRPFFVAHTAPVDPVAGALNVLSVAHGDAVEQAARVVGLSQRQFRRVFKTFYGVSPKHYQRAVRVDRMIRQMHSAPWELDADPDAPIAFADQAHAIREFRALTGVTPNAYRRAKSNGEATLRSLPAQVQAPKRALGDSHSDRC
jgi:AraC-like DNA-binding protein